MGDTLGPTVSSFSSPFWIVFIGSFVVHEVAFLVLNVPYLLFDAYGWFARYKINTRVTANNTSAVQAREFKRMLWAHATQVSQWC